MWKPFKIPTRKPTERRPLGRPRSRWEGSIRIDLNETVVVVRSWDQHWKLLESSCESVIGPPRFHNLMELVVDLINQINITEIRWRMLLITLPPYDSSRIFYKFIKNGIYSDEVWAPVSRGETFLVYRE